MRPRYAAVVADLRRRLGADTNVAEVAAWLSSKGYDRRQIGEILSRLVADTSTEKGRRCEVREGEMSFRVMGPHEMGRFAPEAWGHLLALSSTGALSAPEMEHVIERALVQFDGRIALEDLRALIDGGHVDGSGSGLDQINIH